MWMEKSLQSLVNFFERFPKYILLAPGWPCKTIDRPVPSSWRESFDLTNVELLYVFGIGDGSAYLHCKEWLHEDPTRRIVFFEEDPAAVASLLEADTDLFADPQVDFELLESDSIARFAQKYPVSRIEVVAIPSYPAAKFRKQRLAVLRKTSLASALFVDRLNGCRLFEHFVQNVRQFQGGFYANGLHNAFLGMPAIVCGAGPSLQSDIPLLKQLEGRAIIIAGGSAIAALTAAGIQPHFGVAVDPNLEEYNRFRNSFFFEGPLILSTRVCPAIFGTCNGPFGYVRSATGGSAELWLEKELGLTDPLLTESMPEESMSVTTIALAFAAHMGCTTIVLSGMDLAYTGGKRYVSGVCHEKTNEQENNEKKNAADRIVRRKSKTGKYVDSAIRWVMEAASIAQFAKKHPHIQWINATVGGLSIKGIKEQPLESVALAYMSEQHDIRGIIAREIMLHPMPDISENVLQKIHDSIGRTIGHLEILAGIKSGSKALAECDLQDELATEVLFYDMPTILAQAERLGLVKQGWSLYLEIAGLYSAANEGSKTPQDTLAQFLSEGPFSACDLDIERDKEMGRTLKL